MGNDNENLDNLRSFIGDRTPNQRELADAFYDAMRRRDREDSQAARRFNPSNSSQSFFNDRRNEMQYGPNSRFARSKDYRRTGNVLTDFETGLKDGLLDAVAGGDFKKGVKAALKDFTDAFGFELKDLPHELGKEVLKQFVGSDTGKAIGNAVAKGVGNLANSAFGGKGQGGKSLVNVINKMTQSLVSGGKDIPIQGLTEGADAAGIANIEMQDKGAVVNLEVYSLNGEKTSTDGNPAAEIVSTDSRNALGSIQIVDESGNVLEEIDRDKADKQEKDGEIAIRSSDGQNENEIELTVESTGVNVA